MYHILTILILNLAMMIVTFTTENPLIITSVLIWCIVLLIDNKETKKLKNGLLMVLVMSVITTVINVIIVDAGTREIFYVFGKSIKLEVLLYSFIMSLKLLCIIYIFYILSFMLNTDKALSFLSKKTPKVALVFLLSLKLIPNMKKRLKSIKEVYMVRGVNFEGESKKEKIKAYLPVLSVLLEDSLEKSFDIAESAYVRGFNSGKRSMYDVQKLRAKDYIFILYCIFVLTVFFGLIYFGKNNYSIYECINLMEFFNIYSATQAILILITIIFII
ncbi:MAG: energy-coupling factor transporter transmembrane protein EcfT [Clostridium sp.]|nr:energy-coupling factor transporter transmembrane protein EcfT [Clostridium sp.]MDY3827845.1 energy-coupling factor transporter transmembrane component T [Clostridium sp.]